MPQPCPVRTRRRRASASRADDADLSGVLAGDERSFERLVERHHGFLRGVAAAHGVTGAAANRALVRTWSAFLQRAGSGATVDSVRSLLTSLLVEELASGPLPAPGGPRRA